MVGWAIGVCSPGAFGYEDAARSGEGSVIVGGTGESMGSGIGDKCVIEFCWILICMPVCEPIDKDCDDLEDDLRVDRD